MAWTAAGRMCGVVVLAVVLGAVTARADEAAIAERAERINEMKPGIIMVGSSMQGEGIDFPRLSKELGTPVLDARSGGSLSAWKYAYIKYVIPAATHKPKLVVVETRVNNIVQPRKRMRLPPYKNAVETITGKDRAVLDRLAYSDEGRPKWVPDYDQDDPGPPFDSFFWDFNKAVDHSFLPHMIEASKQRGYQMVVMLYRVRKYAEQPGWEPPQVKQFKRDMAAYLEKRGVLMIDYTQSEEITASMYANGDHISRDEGRPVWTGLVIEDFKAILAGQTPPRVFRDESTQAGD